MRTITRYHRPSSVAEAIALLTRPDTTTILIGGGTSLAAADLAPETEVVDLQSAGSHTIERQGTRVVIGTMAHLQDLIDHPTTPPLLVELARHEGPNTIRNAATVGGAVAGADPDSELLAGLLVHEASVTIEGPNGTTGRPLSELLADRSILVGAIITEVTVAMGGTTASARTGRTPADTSIVAAVARQGEAGLLLALTGVAATPVLVDPADLAALDPPTDFRGTAEYRSRLAEVLTGRVLAQLGGAS